MKLSIELLNRIAATGEIIYSSNWAWGIKYHSESHCFIWCDPMSGDAIKNEYEAYDVIKVILSPKLINSDGWEIITNNMEEIYDGQRLDR